MTETQREAWDDRNALARQLADLRDENADLRKKLEESQHYAAVKSVQFDVLTVEAEDRGITEARIDELADAAWSAIDRRYWGHEHCEPAAPVRSVQ